MTRDELVLRPTDLADAEARLIGLGFARESDARFPVDALDLAAARLLGPVQDLVDDALCVLVIPSESLSGRPFHAMSLGPAPLGAHRRVVYTTRGDELLDGAADRVVEAADPGPQGRRGLVQRRSAAAGLARLDLLVDRHRRVDVIGQDALDDEDVAGESGWRKERAPAALQAELPHQ